MRELSEKDRAFEKERVKYKQEINKDVIDRRNQNQTKY